MTSPATVGLLLDQWLALHSIGRRPRAADFNREIAGIVRANWHALNQSASSVTQADLIAFAERVSHYCPSRFNACVSALRFITPAAKVIPRRPLTAKDRPLLSAEQFSKLLQILDERPKSHAGLVVRFLAHTGLRINEARRLTWSNVHESFILVPAAVSKRGRPRVIPFVNGIRGILDQLRAVSDGTMILPHQSCKRSIHTACRLAGLPRLAHHDFRHLFATRCIQSGVDLPTAARWLGHGDGGALLARTYFHLVDEHSRTMALKVEI